MKPLFVSFYTPDYAEYARNLVNSLELFRLEYDVRAVDDAGTWEANCHYKPRFLWDMLVGHPNRPVVWVDADAEVVSLPTAFDTLFADVAVAKYRRQGRSVDEILSGTVFLQNSPASFRLVDRWIEECTLNPGHWDQDCLKFALEKTNPLSVEWLPIEYTFIYDTHKRYYPEKNPVILHFQHSRHTRDKKL